MIVRDLAGSNSKQVATANAVRRELLIKIATNLEALTANKADDARAIADLAEAYAIAGDARVEVGQNAEARELYRHATERLQSLVDQFPKKQKYEDRLADVLVAMNAACRNQAALGEAETALREAVRHRERLCQLLPDDPWLLNRLG